MANTTFESLVADNQTSIALDELEKFLTDLEKRYLNQVTLLKRRHVENNQNNTIPLERYRYIQRLAGNFQRHLTEIKESAGGER